jgi:hypothetical protein
MKKIFLFLAVAGTAFFTSCGSDDNGGSTTPVATSIALTSDVATVQVGGAFTFTVTNNLAANVTSSSQFFVDGSTTALASNVFTPTAAGTYSVVAKNGTLTSPALSLTVTAAGPVAGDDSIFINGTNNAITNSALVFYGGYAEDPNAEAATHGLFSMLAFDNETGAATGNYIDVEFLVPINAEGGIDFPTPANSTFLDIYEAYIGGNEVTFTTQQGGTLTLTDFPETTNAPHAFSATANYNSGSSLAVNFDGNWLGFYDQSERPAARNASYKVTKIASKSEIAKIRTAAKAKFLKK